MKSDYKTSWNLAVASLALLLGLAQCDEAQESDLPDWNEPDLEENAPEPSDTRNWDVPPLPGKCWGAGVQHTPCPFGPCPCVEFQGQLSTGSAGPDGWLSETGCVEAGGEALFGGKHLYFGTELSPWCGVFACVTPKDPAVRLGIYAVRLDALVCELPPPENGFFECDAAWDSASSVPSEWLPKPELECPALAAVWAANTVCVEVTSEVEPQNFLVGVSAASDVESAEFMVHFMWRNDCGT